MADERDEREEEPKIRIVDRRMLSDDDRAGKGAAPEAEPSAPPKLEIIGGGAPRTAEPPDAIDEAEDDAEDAFDMEGEEPLSEEEAAQMQAEMEQEHFSEIEKQMGRPLTETEKGAVREEMGRQAQQMAALEIAPLLLQLIQEVSARAAVHMGLMPNPYTRLIARNDAQARLAIDSFGAIYDVLKPHLDANMQRELGRILTDLRVNFTSITGGSPTGPSRIIH